MVRRRSLSPSCAFAVFALPFREMHAVMAMGWRGRGKGSGCPLSCCFKERGECLLEIFVLNSRDATPLAGYGLRFGMRGGLCQMCGGKAH